MAKQLNVYSKDDTREEVVIMAEDDFDALTNLHTEMVEDDFSFDKMHNYKKFDIDVQTLNDAAEDIYEDELSDVNQVIELLNSFS